MPERIFSPGRQSIVIRSAERRSLFMALDSLEDGGGGVIEVDGDPGMGKSYLLRELIYEAHRRDIVVLSGRFSEFGSELSFELFLDMITSRSAARSTSGRREPGGAYDGPGRGGLQHARHALRGLPAENGILIVFDDFHWADESSLKLMESFVRWPLDVPVLIVVGQRPRQASERLRAVLAHGTELGTVTRVSLPPLSLGQSARLAGMDTRSPLLHTLHARSNGVPLYLLALACAGGADTEAGGDTDVEATSWYAARVAGELVSLSAREHTVLASASVLGDPCDLDSVAEVAELAGPVVHDAIETLIRHDLLRRSEAMRGLVFRHSSLRWLVLGRTEHNWRRAAHRRAVNVLARGGASATERAWHIERTEAGDDPDDRTTLVEAARECLPNAPAIAIHWLETALRMLPTTVPSGDPVRLDLTLRLAHAHCAAGRLVEGRRQLATLLPAVPAAERSLRAAAVHLAATTECLLGDHHAARALVAAEREAMDEGSQETVRLLICEGLITCVSGRKPEHEQVVRTLRLAREHGDELTVAGASALDVLSRVHTTPDPARLGDKIDENGASFDRLRDDEIAAHPEYLAVQAWTETLTGQFTEAERHFARGASLAEESGHRYLLPISLLGRANACRHLGRFKDAARCVAEVHELAGAMSLSWLDGLAYALESLICAWQPEPGAQQALHYAREAQERLAVEGKSLRLPGVVALATALWRTGDRLRCVTLLTNAGGGPGLPRIPDSFRPMCFELIAAAVADTEGSLSPWSDRILEDHAAYRLPHHRAYVLSTLAHARRMSGDHRTAGDAYRRAAEYYSDAGMVCAQAQALMSAARCAKEDGNRADVPLMLALAEELASQCEASVIIEEAEALRGVLDTEPRDDGPDSSVLEALTDREREIAEIAGRGVRTRDIAIQLSLSPRTVDVHLTRIYRKLNISSRSALARLMADLEPN